MPLSALGLAPAECRFVRAAQSLRHGMLPRCKCKCNLVANFGNGAFWGSGYSVYKISFSNKFNKRSGRAKKYPRSGSIALQTGILILGYCIPQTPQINLKTAILLLSVKYCWDKFRYKRAKHRDKEGRIMTQFFCPDALPLEKTQILFRRYQATDGCIFGSESGAGNALNVLGGNSLDLLYLLEEIFPRTSFYLIFQHQARHLGV